MNTNITYEEVADAITGLVITGKKVTNKSIRHALGDRGSDSTINKFRQRYYSELQNSTRMAVMQQIPETLIPIFSGFWREALQHANEELSMKITQLEERLRGEVEQREVAETALSTTTERAKIAEDKLVTATAEIESWRHAMEEATGIVSKLKKEHQAAEERLARQKAESEQDAYRKNTESELALKIQAAEFEAKLAAAEAARKAAEDKLKDDRERSEKEADRLMQLIYDEREKNKQLQEKISATKKKAEGEVRIATAVADSLKIKVSQLEARLLNQ